MNIAMSPLERERFGVVTARGIIGQGEVPQAFAFCREHNVELLIARVPCDEIATAQALERSGAILCDTLLYYARTLDGELPQPSGRAPIRPARPEDAEAVRDIARAAFAGYCGHYHADPRLDRQACDDTYADWAYNSCTNPHVADAVLLAELGGRVAGFATLRRNSDEEGEGLLFGVHPDARRRGAYASLLAAMLRWCADSDMSRALYSTQLANTASLRALTALGFGLRDAYYTFHLWL